MLRIATGDSSIISSVKYLSVANNYVFWIMWLLMVTFSSIIFLNFVIS